MIREINFKKYIIIAIVILLFLVVICNITIIPTGYTGIKTTFGLISPEPLESGKLYFTIPFCENIRNINNKLQDFESKTKIWGETNDKTPVYAKDIYVTYQILPERSVWIYTNVNDYTKNLITENFIASAVKSGMVELSPEQVTNRAIIEPIVLKKIQESVNEKYGENTIYIAKVIIGDMDFEEEYNKAIQARSIAIQEKSRVQIENETKVSQAEANKQVALLNAEANAEKMRIEAQAQSEANNLLQSSINTEIILMTAIKLWDGKLPTIIGNGSNLMDVTGFINK